MTAEPLAPGAVGATDAYPAAPWELTGQTHGHLLLVKQHLLPATPAGFRPLVVAGRGVVVAGWVDYQGGSVLRYREVFCAVAGIVNRRLTATVTHMWVDSPASRRGGRELWGYPKELAEFELGIGPDGAAVARASGIELARGSFHSWLRLPLRVKLTTGTAQVHDGRLTQVRMVVRGVPSVGTGTFTPGPGSPLGFLASARRIAGFGLADFHASFGVGP